MAEQTPAQIAVSIDTAARMVDVSYWTMLTWVKSGRLPASKVGRGWRIRTADLNALVDANREPHDTAVPA